jgi:hypothetical protein
MDHACQTGADTVWRPSHPRHESFAPPHILQTLTSKSDSFENPGTNENYTLEAMTGKALGIDIQYHGNFCVGI